MATKGETEPEAKREASESHGDEGKSPCGLCAHGRVARRWKNFVGEQGVEVVYYELDPGGLVIQDWQPRHYLGIGQEVHARVRVRTYQGRNGIGYSLQFDQVEEF